MTASIIKTRLAAKASVVAMVSAALVAPGPLTTPADAAARVSVTNDRGTSMADSRYQTKITIRGTGFQTVKGGFGGIYVMFGWAKKGSGWKPSRGGITGRDYRYIPDSERRNNQGFMKFIAFPGSSTQGEAQGILRGGQFSATMNVPGPRFQSRDRNGRISTVDCRRVTCGVITVGAHGVKNPRNETFTPVSFGKVYNSAPTQQQPRASTPGATGSGPVPQGALAQPRTPVTRPGSATGAGTAPGTTQGSPAVPGAPGTRTTPPQVLTDRQTAQVGNALAFTGKGFLPGEQVVAVLDNGRIAVGPIAAGAAGDVAGVMVLPKDLTAGTHEIRLTGSSSGAKPSERFPVRAAAAAASADEESSWWTASRIFLVSAATVFVVAVAVMILTLLRRRRGARVRLTPPKGV